MAAVSVFFAAAMDMIRSKSTISPRSDRDIATALGGRRITLRTLDVGGDKPLPYLPTPAEANPYLGVRGIRLSLAHPGLLATLT